MFDTKCPIPSSQQYHYTMKDLTECSVVKQTNATEMTDLVNYCKKHERL